MITDFFFANKQPISFFFWFILLGLATFKGLKAFHQNFLLNPLCFWFSLFIQLYLYSILCLNYHSNAFCSRCIMRNPRYYFVLGYRMTAILQSAIVMLYKLVNNIAILYYMTIVLGIQLLASNVLMMHLLSLFLDLSSNKRFFFQDKILDMKYSFLCSYHT